MDAFKRALKNKLTPVKQIEQINLGRYEKAKFSEMRKYGGSILSSALSAWNIRRTGLSPANTGYMRNKTRYLFYRG